MIVEKFKKKPEYKVGIITVFPLYDNEDDTDFPLGVIFASKGRKYVCFSDDENVGEAALAALEKPHIELEDLSDVLKCVIYVMLTIGTDFYGIEQNRDAFENESQLSWPKCVWDIVHDVVKFRLDRHFCYGNGKDDLCVHFDLLTRISMPLDMPIS